LRSVYLSSKTSNRFCFALVEQTELFPTHSISFAPTTFFRLRFAPHGMQLPTLS
jgi:hypothetical protein